jgi:hypothetical protein
MDEERDKKEEVSMMPGDSRKWKQPKKQAAEAAKKKRK